jgi:hypothetical protein
MVDDSMMNKTTNFTRRSIHLLSGYIAITKPGMNCLSGIIKMGNCYYGRDVVVMDVNNNWL